MKCFLKSTSFRVDHWHLLEKDTGRGKNSLSSKMLLLLLSHFSHVRLCVIPQTAATRLPRPWDSPGKNTGVGCHFLLQCMKVTSEREVAQSCPPLRDPMDCSPPGSSVHGIFQARVLEWGAIAAGKHDDIAMMLSHLKREMGPGRDWQTRVLLGTSFEKGRRSSPSSSGAREEMRASLSELQMF